MEAGRLHWPMGFDYQITLVDLLQYSKKMRAQQAIALDHMAENAGELDLVDCQLCEARYAEPRRNTGTSDYAISEFICYIGLKFQYSR